MNIVPCVKHVHSTCIHNTRGMYGISGVNLAQVPRNAVKIYLIFKSVLLKSKE